MAKSEESKSVSCDCSHIDVEGKTEEVSEEISGAGKIVKLSQWPIALRLVPVKAPMFQDAHLLVTADCVPFAYPQFNEEYLQGKVLVFGCPKFDDAQGYLKKLTEIFRINNIKSVTLVNMEVPCCFGLKRIVEAAIVESGKNIPLEHTVITVKGEKRH